MERITVIRSLPARGRRAVRTALERRGTRLLLSCLGSIALGFLMAGSRIRGHAMPFAVCLIAASSSPVRALAALLGGSLGYLFFFGPGDGLEYLAVGVLVFSAVCIVGRAELNAGSWLMPALTAALSMTVGFLFLARSQFAPRAAVLLGARLTAAVISSWAFARARTARSTACVLYAGMCVLSGSAALEIAGGITLGQILAVTAGAAAAGTPCALLVGGAAGLAVDLTAAPAVSLTALLCFAGLAASAVPLPLRPARSLVYLGAVVAGVLFAGGQVPELVPAAALGCCLSLLVPAGIFRAYDGSRAARRRLDQAAQVLSEVRALLETTAPDPSAGAAAVFDGASDQVCGSCVLWRQCWRRRSDETYRTLCAVARPMLERGQVTASDFPESFSETCCHFEELVAAINRELERQASRRQYRSRIRECRAVLAGQYEALADLLRGVSSVLTPQETPELRFAPELGAGAAGKGGAPVSGDRGACFQGADGMYYVLLCDGMGAGAEAEAESRRAIRTLAGLLQAGQDPRRALETLNGIYILRGDGSFSTVDLLAVSLVTGQGVLYKWGGAASYLKTAEQTKKIGTAAPPPGFGVGEAHKAEEYRLSLREGELLVLLSDGAGGEEAGRRIAAWGDGTPKALAAALIEEGQTDGEDDRTAVALRLRRRPLGIR